MGWTRPEKTHQLFGSRLAQQVVKHVKYDKEHGFDLPCRQHMAEEALIIRANGLSRIPVRMLPGNLQQITLFVETAEDVGFGVGAAWKAKDGWKSKGMSLGKYLTEADAASFAIGMALKDLPAVLSKTNHRTAEIVARSKLALEKLQNPHHWVLQTIIDARRHAKRVTERGDAVVLTWLPRSASSNGSKTASTAAQRAAKQPPVAMRSASLSYIKQAVRQKWSPTTRPNKHVKDARKSTAARYLQLKSGHATTGAHMLRIGKVDNARCWWCNGRRQTVAHLLLECRKWRRERETVSRKLRAKDIKPSETPDYRNLMILFGDNATSEVLEFVEKTEVGKRLRAEPDKVDL